MSTISRLPESLRIGPMRYKVEPMSSSESNDSQKWGEHNPRTSTIRIAEDSGLDRSAVTLVHEALHAMFLDAGIRSEEEEQIVTHLAPRLLAFLRDNREAVRWVQGVFDEGG